MCIKGTGVSPAERDRERVENPEYILPAHDSKGTNGQLDAGHEAKKLGCAYDSHSEGCDRRRSLLADPFKLNEHHAEFLITRHLAQSDATFISVSLPHLGLPTCSCGKIEMVLREAAGYSIKTIRIWVYIFSKDETNVKHQTHATSDSRRSFYSATPMMPIGR